MFRKNMIMNSARPLYDQPFFRLKILGFGVMLLVLLGGCAVQQKPIFEKPQLLRKIAEDHQASAPMLESVQEGQDAPATKFSKPPEPPLSSVDTVVPKPSEVPVAEGPPLTLNMDSIALPAFINEVFGNLLGLSFDLSPELQNKRDLVTLRVTEPVEPAEVYRLALKVLGSYGVGIQKDGDLYRFIRSAGGSVEPPLLVSGRTLPEVPVSHRPVFQIVPLRVLNNVQAKGWLRKMFKGQPLEIDEDPTLNAVVLKGTPDLVEMALAALQILDQPTMRGRHSLRIEPAFQSPKNLADNLIKVLNSEGFAASSLPNQGSVTVLPLVSANIVLVFAIDEDVLTHVKDWVADLDKPTPSSDGKGLYYYGVQNTRASSLATVLNGLIGGLVAIEKTSAAGDNETPRPKALQSYSSGEGRLVVDDIRNGLIFQGPPEVWARLLPVVQQMDVPAKQVLIEVLVAEITLTEQEELGVEWLVKNLELDGAEAQVGTLDGLGVGSSGLTFSLENAGSFKAALNAFAANDRVTILSTPRVLVKSGEEATLDVGTDVPLVTSQSTAPDIVEDGTSSILQEIQYRKTGVLLQVKPVVHAGRRVDIEVTQEISQAQPNTTSDINSPTILLRKVNTSLSLRDGGSVMLGGLIGEDTSGGRSGIPFLMDLPLVGQLFRVDKTNETRTELIIMITPYIITSYQEAEALTENYRSMLSEQ